MTIKFTSPLNKTNGYTKYSVLKYTQPIIKGEIEKYKTKEEENIEIVIQDRNYLFVTNVIPKKTGVMIVGLGGNNGVTFVGSLIAHREKLHWESREKTQKPTYYGSMMMSSTSIIGYNRTGDPISIGMSEMLPFLDPKKIVVGGWDISGASLDIALDRSGVFEYDLKRQLRDYMREMKPSAGIYNREFLAKNQEGRADNIIEGTLESQLTQIRKDIREFRCENSLDNVIVMWMASTESNSPKLKNYKTWDSLYGDILCNKKDIIPPSVIYASAAILENSTFINGSPQLTIVEGVIDLAQQKKVHLHGSDLKTGQTKLKSGLMEYLVSAGIKPTSICSYNHLGNNDGLNLQESAQFKSKEATKKDVIIDMVRENSRTLFENDVLPDHLVTINYVPAVGDRKRAIDEYESEIYMGGKNTLVIYNVCEDSLLAAPLMLDLVLLAEFFTRVKIASNVPEGILKKVFESECNLETDNLGLELEPLGIFLPCMGYYFKNPNSYKTQTVINALSRQRRLLESLLRSIAGIPAVPDVPVALGRAQG